MKTEQVVKQVLHNPKNKKLLEYLGVEENALFKAAIEVDTRHHEALHDFFDLNIPKETKFLLNGTGVMLNPDSGEIFAFQFGQHDVGFRCNLSRNHIADPAKLNLGYFSNFDKTEITDISILGENWALGINFAGEVEEQICWAYEATLAQG